VSSSSVPAATTTPFSLLPSEAGSDLLGAELAAGGGFEVPMPIAAALRLANNSANFFYFSLLRVMSA